MAEGRRDQDKLLYDKLWRDILCDSEYRIAAKAVAKEIAIELLIPDRIDPFAFAANYETFLRKGLPSVRETWLGKEKTATTPSIRDASNTLKYMRAFPDWFIVAYPDVYLWFDKMQDEQLRKCRTDEDRFDARRVLFSDLFGIPSEVEELEELGEDEICDSHEKWLPKWLMNLVSSYKRSTGKELETCVQETKNSAMVEIYKSQGE